MLKEGPVERQLALSSSQYVLHLIPFNFIEIFNCNTRVNDITVQ